MINVEKNTNLKKFKHKHKTNRKPGSNNGRQTNNHHIKNGNTKIEKSIKLNQCDYDILRLLEQGAVEVYEIHDQLNSYSDQEISLNLSWLEQNNLIKKNIVPQLGGGKIIVYQIDSHAKHYISKN